MQTVKITVWQDDDVWLGYLHEYPDCWTQGETEDELKEHLRDLYEDLTSGEIPGIRRDRVTSWSYGSTMTLKRANHTSSDTMSTRPKSRTYSLAHWRIVRAVKDRGSLSARHMQAATCV